MTASASFLLGSVLRVTGEEGDFREVEAFLLVGGGWLVVACVSALPFLLAGVFRSPVDALFEAMSGLTTTGATVLPFPLERVPRSIHLWRALMQWVGGLGIAVISVAVLARLTTAGARVLRAESAAGTVKRLKPSIAETAKIIWGVYLSLTTLLFLLLFLILVFEGFAPPDAAFEALLHAMPTLGTGGFSNHTASIAFFGSPLMEVVLGVFMLLASVNYALYYYALRANPQRLTRDTEVRFFFAMSLGSFLLIALVLLVTGYEPLAAFRDSFFTASAIVSTTGFTTADFDRWPDAARIFLLLLMFTGGTAGSSAGAIKVGRILLMLKLLERELRKLVAPRAFIPVRIMGEVVDEERVSAVAGFFFAYVSAFLAGTIVMTLLGFDILSAASAVASAMGNVGPGLGLAGASFSWAGFPVAAKTLLTFLMWFGRLEIYGVLILFLPATYKR